MSNLTVNWTPSKDDDGKKLVLRFKQPVKRMKNDLIIDISTIEELTDLKIHLDFYYGIHLRETYYGHAFIGQTILKTQNANVKKNISGQDDEISFLYNKIELRLDTEVKNLVFTLKSLK